MNIRTMLIVPALVAGAALAGHDIPLLSAIPTPMQTIAAQTSQVPAETRALLEFWRQSGPALWFAKDAAFDTRFRERFLRDHEAAARGELDSWMATSDDALALVLLLDQFPRNAFRGTPRMYDTDALARRAAALAFAARYDLQQPQELRKFFVLPFAHSEDLADQERAVAQARISAEDLARAEHHRDIVRRFGRFPHRNEILGRESKAEERQYLENGGYRG